MDIRQLKSPEKLVITCKVKSNNQNNSFLETKYLFATLNHFGGRLTLTITLTS